MSAATATTSPDTGGDRADAGCGGKVTGTTTDVEGKKAECFRQAYALAQLPPPPFAPYQKPIRLR